MRMPLYEFRCPACESRFEQITRQGASDFGLCPKCQNTDTVKLVSVFAISGRGDQRTSTMHGCHGCYTGAHSPHTHKKSGTEKSEPAQPAEPAPSRKTAASE